MGAFANAYSDAYVYGHEQSQKACAPVRGVLGKERLHWGLGVREGLASCVYWTWTEMCKTHENRHYMVHCGES